MNYKYISKIYVKHPKMEYTYFIIKAPKTKKYLKCFRKEKDAIEYLHQYAKENNINEFNLLK
jgi:hypothetical protein